MNLRFWKKKKPVSPTPPNGHSEIETYLRCHEHLEKMEQNGQLYINAIRGGVVMTLLIYQYFFTEGYLKHGDDRRALAFLDKVRATINLRRGVVDEKTGKLPFFDTNDPLYITVASAVDTSKPLFVGVQYGNTIVIEEADNADNED